VIVDCRVGFEPNLTQRRITDPAVPGGSPVRAPRIDDFDRLLCVVVTDGRNRMPAFVRSRRTRVHLILSQPVEVAIDLDREQHRNSGRELRLDRREIGRRDVAVRSEFIVRRIGEGRGSGLRGVLPRDVRHVGQRRRAFLLHQGERRRNGSARVATAVELVIDERRAKIERRIRALWSNSRPDILACFVTAHRIGRSPGDTRTLLPLIADTRHFCR
jgi:hypothetical protein